MTARERAVEAVAAAIRVGGALDEENLPGDAVAAVRAIEEAGVSLVEPQTLVSVDPGLTRALLGDLRRQLVEMADQVAPYADLPLPTSKLADRFDAATGPAWDIDAPTPMKVIALDGMSGVFVEGHGWSYGGDWHAFRADTARRFALALLAAADWSDRQNGSEDAS